MDYAEDRITTRKIGGIAFVVLLHLAIIYALVNGLGTQAVEVLRAPLAAKIIQDVKPPPEAPPPPPPPLIQPPPPYIPSPLVQIAQPPPPPTAIAAVTNIKPKAPPPTPTAQPPVHSAAGLDSSQSCAAPQYPEQAEEMEQTGTSVLQFLIGPDGNVEKSIVAGSSGYSSLDQAALQALSICKFKPAIGADGKPQQAWTSIRYVWTLN